MRPAFSVIFLTTLIGAAQGLFLALYAAELVGFGGAHGFLALGGMVALALSALGLVASFFHLGRPERAWRTATMWRSSWLSREVIALPLFMAAVFGWTAAHALGFDATVALGAAAAVAAAALFVCTAMIYASVKFLQEWASAYTLANYTLAGLASGGTLAAALAALAAPPLASPFAAWALAATLAAFAARLLSLQRNARLRPRSTLQTAIGVRHPRIVQSTQGFTGGSFNTRDFFHGASQAALRHIRRGFLLGAFVLPALLLAGAFASASAALPVAAIALQYAGLLAERWFFFAEANHPQNLYYQAVA